MANIGDRVRFLNATGGGVITRLDNKTAFVEDEDGFESPYLLKDLVVVFPAGHQASVKGASIMFDQKAYEAGKQTTASAPVKNKEIPGPSSTQNQQSHFTAPEETSYGDSPTLMLSFEPDDVKKLGATRFAAVLVNDSNYFIDFVFLRRSSEERGWSVIFNGTVSPNELIDLAVLTHEDLSIYERVALQGVLYKKDKVYPLQSPLNISRKLDLTKFHKFHCFRESRYFEGKVLEFPLLNGGLEIKEPDFSELREGIKNQQPDKGLGKDLAKKYNVDAGINHKNKTAPDNPFKKLPLIEIDLHIGELTDSTMGMEPKDMLELQLDTVRKTMASHSKRIGQKIVFIHGKGEGVLRKAVLDLLKKEYPKATLQDASFREYGFGATLVTI